MHFLLSFPSHLEQKWLSFFFNSSGGREENNKKKLKGKHKKLKLLFYFRFCCQKSIVLNCTNAYILFYNNSLTFAFHSLILLIFSLFCRYLAQYHHNTMQKKSLLNMPQLVLMHNKKQHLYPPVYMHTFYTRNVPF